MLIRRFALGFAFLASLFSMAPAFAACGNGQTPGYGDVSVVRYEKTVCFGVCPSYEVSFSPRVLTYEGRANVTKMGRYESSETAKFSDIIALLAKFDFYSFKIKPVFVTDVPHYIISVERCGATKTLDWPALVYPAVSGSHDIRALFNGLDRITDGVRWQKAGPAH